MACVLVPAAEALVTTIAAKVIEKKEKDHGEVKSTAGSSDAGHSVKISFSKKLKWLTNMLWGGAVLLIYEHVWHGEIVPWFPFLTAASNPADTAEMLHEMSTVGVTMALLITAVWVGMLAVCSAMEKRAESASSADKEETA